MHIRVEIPRQRERHSSFRLGGTAKILTVPLEEISLETKTEEQGNYDLDVNGDYVHPPREVHYYYIYLKNRNGDQSKTFIKYEIHEVEYNRILNILEKLYRVEVEEHNSKAVYEKLPTKVIQEGDMNGLLGLEV